PAENLERALNRALPPSIRVLGVEAVPTEFHARYEAVRKTYEYRIFPGAIPRAGQQRAVCSPMLAPYVWDCPLPLDLRILQQAASYVAGTHDFTSFAAVDPDKTERNAAPEAPAHASPVRRIERSCWQIRDGIYLYRVTGTGFLHHMVRNLVGTFVEAATGRIEAIEIPGILAAHDRSAAGPTAPARGLFLVEVEY
ncbi:MAG: tRNA pseudouridine(38-40) synthase TruA, partial [Granulicella sp.]